MATNNSIIHGHNKRGMRSATYAAWRSMMQRCQNPKNKNYADYGGRGIVVCDRWKSFINFLSDMGEVPDTLTLDRKDNEGIYCHQNCQWSSRTSQIRNRRNTVKIEFNGEIKPIAEWAEITGIPFNTLRKRFYDGWTTDRALTTPVRLHG